MRFILLLTDAFPALSLSDLTQTITFELHRTILISESIQSLKELRFFILRNYNYRLLKIEDQVAAISFLTFSLVKRIALEFCLLNGLKLRSL